MQKQDEKSNEMLEELDKTQVVKNDEKKEENMEKTQIVKTADIVKKEKELEDIKPEENIDSSSTKLNKNKLKI